MPERRELLRHWPELDGKTLLICIGAAKCGTSWLFQYLSGLAGTVVSPLKEVHFFDARFPQAALGDMEAMARARLQPFLEQEDDPSDDPSFQASVDRLQMAYDDNAYFGHFARLCRPDTRTFCDITPAYSAIGPEGFQEIKRFATSQNIRLRVLFIMRDPTTRLWSQLRQLEQVNPRTAINTRWPEAIKAKPIVDRADYVGIVSALDRIFTADERLYLFYETLFQQDTLQRFCDFADLPFTPAEIQKKVNETIYKAPMPEGLAEALVTQLAPQYHFCRTRFGAEIPASWER